MTDTSTEAVERFAAHCGGSLSDLLRALAAERDAAQAEAARMREALQQIRDYEPDRTAWSIGHARAALGSATP